MRKMRIWLAALAVGLLLIVVAQTASSAALKRGPYLQTPTASSMVLKWSTDVATDSVVKFGNAPTDLTSTVSTPALTTEHEVTVTGLAPNTRYYYSIGSSREALSGGDTGHFFTTSPVPGTNKATRVWIVGDSGTADENAAAVRDAYKNYTGGSVTDLWLMLGDNAYEDGTDKEFQAALFDTYPELLRTIPVWPAFGNHDGRTADSATQSGAYYDIFSLPANAEAGGVASGTEAYYSFDYANIHFISLDSAESDRSPAGAMTAWLEADLTANGKDWVIAFWHHPPFTKGSHNSDKEKILIEMRENALPILETHGVDLVLSGHSHSYERSHLIAGHYGKSGTLNNAAFVNDGDGREDGDGAYEKTGGSGGNTGTVYVVAGSAGKLGKGKLDHPAMAVSLRKRGSMVLKVNGHRLDAIFLDSGGNIGDSFTIVKRGAGGR